MLGFQQQLVVSRWKMPEAIEHSDPERLKTLMEQYKEFGDFAWRIVAVCLPFVLRSSCFALQTFSLANISCEL